MSRKAKTWNRAGFTLVEMTLVITLLALFAALAAPSLARWREAGERREFPNRLRRLFAIAREQAIVAKAPRSVAFEDADGAFRLVWKDPETAQEIEGGRVALPDDFQVGRLTLGAAESSPDEWRVTFYPDGTAEPSGVELRDGQTLSVRVDEQGRSTFATAPLPEPESERWDAGDHEIRQ